MINLNAKDYQIVINLPTGEQRTPNEIDRAISSAFGDSGYFFAWIKHDKDVSDTGELKTLHYHLVLHFDARIKATSIIVYLSEALHVPTQCISIRKAFSIAASVQYLTHKNEPTKEEYEFSAIRCNDFDKLQAFYDMQELDTEGLILAIKEGATRIDLIRRYGATKYNTIRNTINDIYGELFGNEKK